MYIQNDNIKQNNHNDVNDMLSDFFECKIKNNTSEEFEILLTL